MYRLGPGEICRNLTSETCKMSVKEKTQIHKILQLRERKKCHGRDLRPFILYNYLLLFILIIYFYSIIYFINIS